MHNMQHGSGEQLMADRRCGQRSPAVCEPLRWCAAVLLVFLVGAPKIIAAPAATPTPAGALRAAIVDLSITFGDRYPDGKTYLARLDALARRIDNSGPTDASRRELETLRREALLANPLVRDQPILFVARPQYRPDHHNTATMFQTGEINTGSFRGGAALKTIDFGRGGKVTTLLDVPEGIVRDPDVHFDGKRVLIALRHNRDDDYHLYEINADGGELRQITFGAGLSDIDPIYLPGGKIVFSSTREPKYCQCNRHIMCNLFLTDSNGKQIEQIGHSTLHEGHASLLDDGRVIYDRWEYVDRNFGDAQGLWAVNPDGTNHAIAYGNATRSPGGVLDARAIPGTELIVATFSSCHDRPWGALAVIDPRKGTDGEPPVVRIWPASARDLIDKGNYDTFKRVSPKYEDPFPLSERYFLCSRTVGKGELVGIYLLDVFGNEILLHSEGAGCFDPMPLAARLTPPAIRSRVKPDSRVGYFYVADVYRGSGMNKIERGTVKSLRIVEVPEKRHWTQQAWMGSGTQAPGMAYDDFNNKQIIGTVPVERDGSVYFSVPADTFVYFQLLDERGMMVQSMRSGTIVRPGETVGCVGCHEKQQQTVGRDGPLLAMSRPPSEPAEWYGPPRKFSYTQEVQPAFDKHCVSCHDYGKPAGEKLNLAGDLGLIFNTSYSQLRGKNYVRVVGAGPANVLEPKSWGSHASPLAKVLAKGHGDAKIDRQVKLDRESFDRIVTWIDINAPYYPDYASAYRNHRYGRSPLDPRQLGRLSQLTGEKLTDQRLSDHISFTRPELSPCLTPLAKKNEAAYREALAIIQAGKKMLEERPRADMPGFQYIGVEAEREERYRAYQESGGAGKRKDATRE